VLPGRHTHLLDQREGARRSRTESATKATGIRSLLQGRDVPIQCLRSRFPRIYHQLLRDRHGIRPHIHHRRLAYSEVGTGCTGAVGIRELLPTVHQEICKGYVTPDGATKGDSNIKHTANQPEVK